MRFHIGVLTDHISKQFNHELEALRNHLLAMGGMVEKQMADAVTAALSANGAMAKTGMNKISTLIDGARYSTRVLCYFGASPTGSRITSSADLYKIATDLERIGDETTKIAGFALQLCQQGRAPVGYQEIRHLSF